MRVIGGEFRSRRLKAPAGLETRPTPDRLRESLFDILSPVIEGSFFVDAYAGGGSVGIEALSRGAARVIFIERNRKAAGIIEENLTSLKVQARADVRCVRAAPLIGSLETDILFLDPPYGLAEEYRLSLDAAAKHSRGIVIAQHSSRQALDENYGGLQRYRVLKQGDNSLSFYQSDR